MTQRYLLNTLAQIGFYVLYSFEQFGLILLIFVSQQTYYEFLCTCFSDKVTFWDVLKSFASQLLEPQQVASCFEERKVASNT